MKIIVNMISAMFSTVFLILVFGKMPRKISTETIRISKQF